MGAHASVENADWDLLRAARRNDIESCQMLLEQNASPCACDHDNNSVLQIAVANYFDNGPSNVVELLLNSKADPNHANKYRVVPLHVAFSRASRELCLLLLFAGADCDVRDTISHLSCTEMGRRSGSSGMRDLATAMELVKFTRATPDVLPLPSPLIVIWLSYAVDLSSLSAGSEQKREQSLAKLLQLGQVKPK